MNIRLKFGALLDARGVTPHRLAQRHGLSRNTVYALANPRGERVRLDLDVLAAAMAALERESGESVALTDVLEIVHQSAEEETERAARERALSLLIRPALPGKPRGSKVPVAVSGPPIEDVLREHRGPKQ